MSKRIALILLALGVVAAAALRAQAPPNPANDAVAALVMEVRALRTELTQIAIANVRSQLLVTRIQLQEQRLMHLDRERMDVSGKLADAEKARIGLADQLKRTENAGPETTSEQRRELDAMVTMVKSQLQAAQTSETALRAEQDSLLNAISTEQARWSDFNSRLDQLERALPAR